MICQKMQQIIESMMPALVEGGKGNALFEKLGFTEDMAQKIHEVAP
jgi:hypothetical protein